MTKTVDVSGAKLPIEELHLTFITDKLRNDYGFLESTKFFKSFNLT